MRISKRKVNFILKNKEEYDTLRCDHIAQFTYSDLQFIHLT